MALVTTTLASSVAVHDNSVNVVSATSIEAGRYMTIGDEYLKVMTSYAIGSTVVPVMRGLEGSASEAHGIGEMVTHGAPSDFTGDPVYAPSDPDGGGTEAVAGRYNVIHYGAVGDGVTDDTDAIQTLITNAPHGAEIFFPAGVYMVSATLERIGTPVMFRGIGPGKVGGGSHLYGGSIIKGNVAGPIIKMESGSSNCGGGVCDMGLINDNAAGTGIWATGQQGMISRVAVIGWRGIIIPYDAFNWTLSTINCLGINAGEAWSGSTGIYVSGHSFLYGCDVTSFDVGVQMNGGSSLVGARIEVNRVGLLLGMTLEITPGGFVGFVTGVTLEANDYGLWIENSGGHVAGVHIQGSSGAPSGQSISGVKVRIANSMTLSSVQAVNAYSTASWDFTHPELTITRMTMIGCYGQNGYVPSPEWLLPDPIPAGMQFINCNNPA